MPPSLLESLLSAWIGMDGSVVCWRKVYRYLRREQFLLKLEFL